MSAAMEEAKTRGRIKAQQLRSIFTGTGHPLLPAHVNARDLMPERTLTCRCHHDDEQFRAEETADKKRKSQDTFSL
mgnify:CR=1 FL=1